MPASLLGFWSYLKSKNRNWEQEFFPIRKRAIVKKRLAIAYTEYLQSLKSGDDEDRLGLNDENMGKTEDEALEKIVIKTFGHVMISKAVTGPIDMSEFDDDEDEIPF